MPFAPVLDPVLDIILHVSIILSFGYYSNNCSVGAFLSAMPLCPVVVKCSQAMLSMMVNCEQKNLGDHIKTKLFLCLDLYLHLFVFVLRLANILFI